jgi:hypothetical protein
MRCRARSRMSANPSRRESPNLAPPDRPSISQLIRMGEDGRVDVTTSAKRWPPLSIKLRDVPALSRGVPRFDALRTQNWSASRWVEDRGDAARCRRKLSRKCTGQDLPLQASAVRQVTQLPYWSHEVMPKPAGRPAVKRTTIAVICAALPIPFVYAWPVSQILGCVIGGVGVGITLTLLGSLGRRMTSLPPIRTMGGVVAGVLAAAILSKLLGYANVVVAICWGFSVLALIALLRWGNRNAPGSGPVPRP